MAVRFPDGGERLLQGRGGQRRRRLAAAGESERQHGIARQLTAQGDITGTGRVVVPAQGAVAPEILPAVADADVTGTALSQGILLRRVAREQCQTERPLFRPQYIAAAVARGPGGVAMSGATEVRGEQYVGAQSARTRELYLNKQDIAQRIGTDAQMQLETRMHVGDLDGRHAGFGELHPAGFQALDLHPEAVAVADDKAEIADLGDVDARVIHLVDDTVADGEPEPGRTQRGADEVLVAARPGGFYPRCTRCVQAVPISHRHSRVPVCTRQTHPRRSGPRRFRGPRCRRCSWGSRRADSPSRLPAPA